MSNAQNEIYCECGYVGVPMTKRDLSTGEIVLSIVLTLLLGPVGIIYFFVKFSKSKKLFCPSCGKNLSGAGGTFEEEAKSLGNRVVNAAKDPNVRGAVISGVKSVKKSANDFHDSMYI